MLQLELSIWSIELNKEVVKITESHTQDLGYQKRAVIGLFNEHCSLKESPIKRVSFFLHAHYVENPDNQSKLLDSKVFGRLSNFRKN